VTVALAGLEREFAALYSPLGRRSSQAAKLLRAMLLQAFYSIGSERLLKFLNAVLALPSCDSAGASGSVVQACVSFERFWPWKFASALRPPPSAGVRHDHRSGQGKGS
jgi:hypothetical protein